MVASPFPKLRNFPNAAVGIALGLGGQTLLWKSLSKWPPLADVADIAKAIQWVFWVACVTTLAAFLIAFAAKMFFHWDVVRKEAYHPVRVNFFLGPVIALCMLSMGLPPSLGPQEEFLQAMWTIAFFYQCSATLVIYHRWLYVLSASVTASAPYLLSIVTWFLLCAMGGPAGIDQACGMPLRAMCFGVGTFFAVLIYPLILLGIHAGQTEAGSPALFLMLAPLSVAGNGIIGLSGGVTPSSQALFGAVLFMFFFLVRSAPKICARPAVLGIYWAYVFPVAAMAMLSISIASGQKSAVSEGIAAALSIVAIIAFLMVMARMTAHMVNVCREKDTWTDPVVMAMDKAKAEAAAAAATQGASAMEEGSQSQEPAKTQADKPTDKSPVSGTVVEADKPTDKSPVSGTVVEAGELVRRLGELETIVVELRARDASRTACEDTSPASFAVA
eukprot:TRINITY_DN5900_c0_g1_i1.p1 TRINITY_DN5900_c0_g1~~TRINITY_DN5900_c0_g1_i1.p1  ORF type:complete len:453 (+),score=71.91 TRINITY_DN5900_c0_g1_i1:26-1360(+)